VINIVTGDKTPPKVLAEHDEWTWCGYFGNQAAGAEVERASAGNMNGRGSNGTEDWNDRGRARREF